MGAKFASDDVLGPSSPTPQINKWAHLWFSSSFGSMFIKTNVLRLVTVCSLPFVDFPIALLDTTFAQIQIRWKFASLTLACCLWSRLVVYFFAGDALFCRRNLGVEKNAVLAHFKHLISQPSYTALLTQPNKSIIKANK